MRQKWFDHVMGSFAWSLQSAILLIALLIVKKHPSFAKDNGERILVAPQSPQNPFALVEVLYTRMKMGQRNFYVTGHSIPVLYVLRVIFLSSLSDVT